MNDDLRIRSFKNKMINMMNAEPLPLEVKRLVLIDVLNETSRAADESVKTALQLAEAEKEHEKTKKAIRTINDAFGSGEVEESNPENSPE